MGYVLQSEAVRCGVGDIGIELLGGIALAGLQDRNRA